MMPKSFVVSASGLRKFFECPFKYALHMRMRPRQIPQFYQDGLDVHALMAGEKCAPNERSIRMAKMLTELVEGRGYEILDTEVKQYVHLTKGIKLVRVLDALAYDEDGKVIIDYKTSKKLWDKISATSAPAGMGFQAQTYVEPGTFVDWPDRIDFLIVASAPAGADYRKYTDVVSYEWNQPDHENLIRAAQMVKDATKSGNFPKNRGAHCVYCDFMAACYEQPGWKDKFEVKDE
jgi:CRISPR/Cas system-associated exonuclease Cas4 (RecB family)